MHTDASTAARPVLTQQVEGSEESPGYASKRFGKHYAPNDREVLQVLHALEHFKAHLQPVHPCDGLRRPFIVLHQLKSLIELSSVGDKNDA